MGSLLRHLGFHPAGRDVKKEKWRVWFKFHQPSGSPVIAFDQSIVEERRQVQYGSLWVLESSQVFSSSPGLDFLLFTLGRGMSPHGAACYQDQIKELWNSLKDSKSHRNTKHYMCGNDLQILLSLDLSCIGSKYHYSSILDILSSPFSLFSLILVLHPITCHPVLPKTTLICLICSLENTHTFTHTLMGVFWVCGFVIYLQTALFFRSHFVFSYHPTLYF